MMVDIYSKEKCSEIMSKIRDKDTKPEICVRRFLFMHGFRYRKNDSRLPGKPDIVLPKHKTVIFVHGCLWHGHQGCTIAHLPKTNEPYWSNKFEKNKNRDETNIQALTKLGWNVCVLWECEIRSKEKKGIRLTALLQEIRSQRGLL